MSHSKFLRILFAALSALLLSVPAQAQLFRAYLASDGLDSNPCTLPAPCRLLPRALTAVASGGEIWMLDSANYNIAQVDVTKSVTILAIPGALGSVLAISGYAFFISTPGVVVALRNLVIRPGVGGADGIVMLNGAKLSVENGVISSLGNSGIYVSTPARVRVIDTVFRDNWAGVNLRNGAIADISGSKFLGNQNGVLAYGSPGGTLTTAALSDVVIAGASYGAYAESLASTATVRLSLTRSTVSNNDIGVQSDNTFGGTAVITIGNSMVTGNQTGLAQIGTGVVESLGNNTVRQNTNASSGVITTVAPM